jgi:hypothetical protein
LVILTGCGTEPLHTYSYCQPERLNDGFEAGSLAQANMNVNLLESAAEPYTGPDNRWFNHLLRSIPPGDNTWGARGYSYAWWTHDFSQAGKKIPAYWAFGWGGQNIVVFPDQNAVGIHWRKLHLSGRNRQDFGEKRNPSA